MSNDKRLSIRLNLEKIAHQEADKILEALPKGRKSEYVINAIIKANDQEKILAMIKDAVKEALEGVSFSKADTNKGIDSDAINFLQSL